MAKLPPFWLVFVVVALAGCRQSVDLSAVAALGKSTAQGQAAFAALSNDFYESCVRTVGWQRAVDPSSTADASKVCADNALAARQWQSANSIVTSYLVAIGSLASGPDQGDYGLAAFAATFANLGGSGASRTFGSSQQTAVSGAAKSLIDDYFKFKRREDLAAIIPNADSALSATIDVLEDVAKTNYITQLSSERNEIAAFVGPNLARARLGYERVYVVGYRTKELLQVDEHQAAVDHYIAALERIRSTHREMANAIASNAGSDLGSIVNAYISEYTPEIDALAKAFK